MDQKKVLKNIVEGDQSGGRLQSLKLPRDLSLGNKPKKQYTPNLNVVRNKDKAKEFLKKVEQKRKEKSTQRVKPDRNDNQRYVQSTGIFSHGAGESRRANLLAGKRVSFRESNTTSNLFLPRIKKDPGTVNKKEEDDVLNQLLNCDIDDSDEEKMDLHPLSIPSESKKDKIWDIIKNDVVKKENCSDEYIHTILPPPFNFPQIYSDENPALSVVKLPDSFAGKGLSDDPKVKKLFDYPLSGMMEGKIGKMIIRKSGKMEMQIGNVTYKLMPAKAIECKEQLLSIAPNESGQTSTIAVLGEVQNNFVMLPDFDILL